MSLSRRQFVARSAAATAALPFLAPLASASPLATPPRWAAPASGRAEFTDIRRGVGAFTDRGGTIGYLKTDDALVAVDTQFPESAQTFLDGLRDGSARRLDVLVNTHHHGDHTAGNAVLAPVADLHVAHEAVPGLQRARAVGSDGYATQRYADETFRETWRADLGDEVLALHYFGPAHTCGDAVVHFERADVVHMGDLVFNRRQPFIDRAGGASVEAWGTLLETVHGRFSDETVFVFGHAGDARLPRRRPPRHRASGGRRRDGGRHRGPPHSGLRGLGRDARARRRAHHRRVRRRLRPPAAPSRRSMLRRSPDAASSPPRMLPLPDAVAADLPDLITRALAEDLGTGDVTTEATIPEGTRATARFLLKEDGVVAGLAVAERVFEAVDPELQVTWTAADGDRLTAGTVFGTVAGRARSILVAERLALNLMQRMGGVATAAARMAEKAAPATVLDTRKTVPGLRMLDKWAVALGGAQNHRVGLYDMVLVKDNHIAAAGGIRQAIEAVGRHTEAAGLDVPVEVEARTLDEVDAVLAAVADGARVDRVLLDNMARRTPDGLDVSVLEEAVRRVGNAIQTEASGNVTLDTVGRIGATGVDFISSGALTHSVTALDVSLKIGLEPG